MKFDNGLIAALTHYSEMGYDLGAPTVFAYTDPRTGYRLAFSVEKTCSDVLRILEELRGDEELAMRKLIHLQKGLKDFGCEDIYEKVMGEKLLVEFKRPL